MQFTAGKGVTLFVGIVFCACGLGFAFGVLIGRQFPAHHFERFGESGFYLLDSTTGRVCNPLKAPKASTNLFDQLVSSQSPAPQKDANGFPIVSKSDPFAAYAVQPAAPDPVPACKR